MGTSFATLSPETRAENLTKAKAARAAASAARKASTLRRDFLDSNWWDELAQQVGVRLPPWGQSPTPAVMTRFLNKIGKDWAWERSYSADRNKDDFRQRNPAWPARAWAGSLLEWLAQERA